MYFSKKKLMIAVAVISALSGVIYAGINEVIQARDLYRKKAPVSQIQATTQTSTTPTAVSRNDFLASSLDIYPMYWAALRAAETDDDLVAGAFLRQQKEDSYLTERVRNQWLKSLARRMQWQQFTEQYSKLSPEGTDQEVACYAQLNDLTRQNTPSALANELVQSNSKLTDGCNMLITIAIKKGHIPASSGWQRVRALLGENSTTLARSLANTLGSPLPANLGAGIGSGSQGDIEGALFAASSPKAIKDGSAISRLSALSSNLTEEQAGFVWGKIALAEAKKQNARTALGYYNRADAKQLNDEQWEWWARSALRIQDWNTLASIIRNMPAKLQGANAWQYWLARSYHAQGKTNEARKIWQQVSTTGRNFYAILSTEELGERVNAKSNTSRASAAEIRKMAQEPALARAIALFQASNEQGRPELREDGRREWRHAMRNRTEQDLLAASALAEQVGFLEMAIHSADQTNEKLDFSLRYLSPYRDITHQHASNLGLDTAWVYGLIRQESRFIIGARSNVGASGLMQLMPATAKWVAGKTGIGSYNIDDINTNIYMGTWYLNHVRQDLGHEVLATAGYNAGPGRARAWRAGHSLEGAIYAETIPFNETRDYVQKVMANATYYSDLFGHRYVPLKSRMGTIPGK